MHSLTVITRTGLFTGQTTFDESWARTHINGGAVAGATYFFQVAKDPRFRLGDDLLEVRVTWPRPEDAPVANTALSDLRLNGRVSQTAVPLVVTVTNAVDDNLVYWGYRRSGRSSYTAAGSSPQSSPSTVIRNLTEGTRYDFVAALSADLQTGRTLLTASTEAAPTVRPVTLATPSFRVVAQSIVWTISYGNLDRLANQRVYAEYREGTTGVWQSLGSAAINRFRTSGSLTFARSGLRPDTNYQFRAALDANFSVGVVTQTNARTAALPNSRVTLSVVSRTTTSLRIRATVTNWQGKRLSLLVNGRGIQAPALTSGSVLWTISNLEDDTSYIIRASVAGGGSVPGIYSLTTYTVPDYPDRMEYQRRFGADWLIYLTSTRASIRVNILMYTSPRRYEEATDPVSYRVAGATRIMRTASPIPGLSPDTWYVVTWNEITLAIKTKR